MAYKYRRGYCYVIIITRVDQQLLREEWHWTDQARCLGRRWGWRRYWVGQCDETVNPADLTQNAAAELSPSPSSPAWSLRRLTSATAWLRSMPDEWRSRSSSTAWVLKNWIPDSCIRPTHDEHRVGLLATLVTAPRYHHRNFVRSFKVIFMCILNWWLLKQPN